MSLTDYSGLEAAINDAPEPKVLAKGKEVKARIILVRTGNSEKRGGAVWYSVVYDVPDDPMVIEFGDFFWDLSERDKLTPKEFTRGLYKFKCFAKAFGLDYSKPFNWTEDLTGLEGWLIVGVKNDPQYGDQNTVSKYVAGQGGKREVSAPVDDNDIPF